MVKYAIITVILLTITIHIQAQDSIVNPENTDNKKGTIEQMTGHQSSGINANNMSMSETARETPSGKGKGAIVSTQAKQLGSSKRITHEAEKRSFNNKGSKKVNWTAMHASSFRRNPDMLALNAAMRTHRNGPHGKK